MKLIVGLGNPGNEYDKTRHNIGFMVIDNYANKYNLKFNKTKFNGLYVKTNIKNQEIILLKPQKYMNLSGEVVKNFVNYYKINIEDILVINDDLDLKCGSYRLKQKGSCGGHNGLRNIELCLNSMFYKRLKIGISADNIFDKKDYVLGKFSNQELEKLHQVINISENIIDDYLTNDFENIMSKYNCN